MCADCADCVEGREHKTHDVTSAVDRMTMTMTMK